MMKNNIVVDDQSSKPVFVCRLHTDVLVVNVSYSFFFVALRRTIEERFGYYKYITLLLCPFK